MDESVGELDLRSFSADYGGARTEFLKSAGRNADQVTSYQNPLNGPGGESLYVDAAWFGSKDAPKVLVTLSGTHGVEGFCGSACQIDSLSWLHPQNDVALLHIHAVNPYGFAWLRRFTEEGVDLNRNWVDFSKPLPTNPGHDELVDAILPPDLNCGTLRKADERLQAYRSERGFRAFRFAVGGGQYDHPKSLYFGGLEPTWARQTQERIIVNFALPKRDLVTVVDYHTGAGPYGYGQPFSAHPTQTVSARRVREWFGPSLEEMQAEDAGTLAEHGCCSDGWSMFLGEQLSFIYLEFGTYGYADKLAALRADHLLHSKPPVVWSDTKTQSLKAHIRKHYFPDTKEWNEMLIFRSRQVLRQALSGLTGPAPPL